LREEFWAVVEKKQLFSSQEKVVVAVSGGADSLALLDLLNSLPPAHRPRLHAAHLNHRLRGKDAEADADYVRQVARDLGLHLTVGVASPLPLVYRQALSVEAAARQLRYAFLLGVARAEGAKKIALGHHLNDQAETLLLHLFRGSGLDGLAGMKYFAYYRDKILVRPLLDFSHQQLVNYCIAQGYKPRHDRSNDSPAFTRNRIRRYLIPWLKENINPSVEKALARTAAILQKEKEYLDALTEREWHRSVLESADDMVKLDKKKVIKLHPAARARLLRKAYARIRGGAPFDLGGKHLHMLDRLLQEPEGNARHLPGGVTVWQERDRIVLSRRPAATPCSRSYSITIPGDTLFPCFGILLQTEVVERKQLASLREGKNTALLDWDKLKTPLLLRQRVEGDYFRPLGMGGRGMKLKDFLNQRHVPRRERDLLPLVTSAGEIAWVGGVEISELFKVEAGTSRVLRLKIKPLKKEE